MDSSSHTMKPCSVATKLRFSVQRGAETNSGFLDLLIYLGTSYSQSPVDDDDGWVGGLSLT